MTKEYLLEELKSFKANEFHFIIETFDGRSTVAELVMQDEEAIIYRRQTVLYRMPWEKIKNFRG